MQLLTDMGGEVLERGDILRFPTGWHYHDDKSRPLDMIIREEGGLVALMYCSGYDAGFTRTILPKESQATYTYSIRVDWLLENWSSWFAYDVGGQMRAIPIEGVMVLRRQAYSIADYDPNDMPDREEMLDRAIDCMSHPSHSTIRRLLAQSAGQFMEMSALAPNLDLGRQRILVSWQPFEEDGYALMILYFNAESLASRVSLHTEHWKSGRSEH